MKEAAARAPVYDLGTSARFAKEMAFVQSLFDEARYVAGGFKPDRSVPHPCDIDCDIQQMDGIASGSVGSVICLEVIEHVQSPEKSVSEMHRILQPGGVCVLSTPFLTGYHGKNKKLSTGYDPEKIQNEHAAYSDYWRFTHEGLWHLFQTAGFSDVTVYPVDGPILARLELIKLGGFIRTVPGLTQLIKAIDTPALGKLTTRHFVLAKK